MVHQLIHLEINIEHMKGKPTFNGSTPLNASLNVRSLASPKAKKVEGFDRTTSSQMFNSKVTKIKNKPKIQGLEDQYINGLQDEMKYLEMELKLLQQKDQERHGQIDQLQKFFGDGIPINENILAIKNGFNNEKNSKEKKIGELAKEREERSGLINELGRKVEELMGQLGKQEKGNKQAQEQSQTIFSKLVFQQASLRRLLERQDEELKSFRLQNRKLNQKIEKITRQKLIENITNIKYQNHKMTRLNNLKEQVGERETELLDLQKQYNGLLKEEQEKGYLLRLQEDNLSRRKKVIGLERDHDNLKNKIKEKEMELEQKLRERMAEVNCKADIQDKVQQLKVQINKENTITVEAVEQISREKEVERLKHIVDLNRKHSKYIDHYSTVLSNMENNIQILAQRKPEARSQLMFLQQEVPKLKNRLQAEKQRQVGLYGQTVQVQQQSEEMKLRGTPIQERTVKKNDQIKAYLQQRRRVSQQIKIKQKQLQLIFVLKGLNLQQAEIAKSSNGSIQEELISFLKSWQKIQRSA